MRAQPVEQQQVPRVGAVIPASTWTDVLSCTLALRSKYDVTGSVGHLVLLLSCSYEVVLTRRRLT